MDQLYCKLGQSLDPPACKSIFDVDVLPLDVTKVTQPLTEGVDFRRGSGRAVMQKTDPRDFRWLLRMRGKRPSHSRAADDELAAPHSITSSARKRSAVGISTPIVFAVLRFMTSSYFIGCSTGRSPVLRP